MTVTCFSRRKVAAAEYICQSEGGMRLCMASDRCGRRDDPIRSLAAPRPPRPPLNRIQNKQQTHTFHPDSNCSNDITVSQLCCLTGERERERERYFTPVPGT